MENYPERIGWRIPTYKRSLRAGGTLRPKAMASEAGSSGCDSAAAAVPEPLLVVKPQMEPKLILKPYLLTNRW